MTLRTLLLVDGEHYPPVIIDALPHLLADGYEPVAAIFMGGFEKTSRPPELGVPLVHADPETSLVGMIDEHDVEVVLDLSDEPILDHRQRFRLAALTVANGARYVAGGMMLEPVPRPVMTARPTISIIGTGKRTGKTAVSIDLARRLRGTGVRPCIVTMGRGGPASPVVVTAGSFPEPVAGLEALSNEGLHATSDYIEDAIFAEVDTIGTRRLGAGPTGITVIDAFAEGVGAAEGLSPDVIIYEGSGTAIPPAWSDHTITVCSGDIDPEFLLGYLGPVRIALSSALIAIGAGAGELIDPLRSFAPELPVFTARLRPEPTVEIRGRHVVAVSTAKPAAAGDIARSLLDLGAKHADVLTTLSDRRRLENDLDMIRPGMMVLAEVKAAAADIVIPAARARGADIGLIHNAVDMATDWEELLALIGQA